MKLRKIKWKNHPVLGDLALNFINNQTGKPYSTILLAGENGTGKSTILEAISDFLNLGPYVNFEYIEYEIDGNIYKTSKPTGVNMPLTFFDIVEENGNVIHIRHDRGNNYHLINSEIKDLRHYGCVYSKARSDYKTHKITSTTISELDKDKYDIDTTEDFTSLKQLIVDVVNQDNASYTEVNRFLGNNPKSWDDFY
ncbi:TPA: AAA family ATPase, partial [Serratia fonticola]